MKCTIPVLAALLAVASGTARADDIGALRMKVEQLESELAGLRGRLDRLGTVAVLREVKATDPVFLGRGANRPAPLTMDDSAINCPARSFVTAIQVLKTGNTVSQIRYACRGIE